MGSNRLSLAWLAGAIILCEAAGAIGGIATAGSVTTWYPTLTKSPLNPPSWVFAPVWTVLYALMGVALYRVWMAQRRLREAASWSKLLPFFIQLALNVGWSVVFFGLRQPLGALFVIVTLLAAILVTMRAFARVDKPAAWLLAPYAAWVTFATCLNASIWLLNRG